MSFIVNHQSSSVMSTLALRPLLRILKRVDLNNLPTLFRFNLAVLCLSSLAGATIARLCSALYVFEATQPTNLGTLKKDCLFIIMNNLGVMVLVVIGAFSFGVYSLIVVVFNGLRVGFDLVAILQTEPRQVFYLLPYLPFELASLCLAAAASQLIGVCLFEYLFQNTLRGHIRTCVRWILLAALLVIGAAVVEASSKFIRDNNEYFFEIAGEPMNRYLIIRDGELVLCDWPDKL